MAFNFIPNAWKIAAKAVTDLKSSGDVVLSSLVGAPNGVAGLDSNGDIVATPIHRVDTAANLAAITLKSGEIALASDTNDILRGDGSTLGGRLVSGGIRRFSIGPSEITSTTSQLTSQIPLVPGTYRMWGYAGFSGDTDFISNFNFTSGNTQPVLDVSQVNEIGSCGGIFSWRVETGLLPHFTPPVIYDWRPTSLWAFGLFTASPPTLDGLAGRCYFDITLPVSVSHNRPFSLRLRAAKVGTPTILGAYRFFVQRLV